MKSSTCKIGFLTDLHMGKPRISPAMVRDNLARLFYPRMPEMDLIVLGGDFFDYALSMNSDAGVHAAMIIDEMLHIAKVNNIYVRVVTGTLFHDRHQNKFFSIKAKGMGSYKGVPLVRVFKTVELEHIKPLNLSIVYCPDNQTGDHTELVLALLKSHRVNKVDFLCSHGYFEYLLPKGIPHMPPNMLNYRALNPYISGLILNGHVHIPIIHKKLISGGSFERLAHGEEHDKGYHIITYNTKTHKSSVEFVVNDGAIPFITIPVARYDSVDQCVREVEGIIAKIRMDQGDNKPIHIRLSELTGTDDFMLRYLNDKYDNVIVTIKTSGSQDTPCELDEVIQTLPVITEENLPELVYENIKDQDITLNEIKEFL